ncbi:hypothetical protein [Candidatus Nitrotoga sp. M5]|uniref:hypothetical protein n=1 Tax=Candidatus Nitrotoga sp. M5 TaxID=2890409 RepID=UPI001EF26022|nr:hypothetical protein [Candidatus Nitrotoga sp. M5]CAH1385466.1 hypothetical protein NTGM5_120114 [Candidatus Nitrotoga sp. M5]
MPIPLYYLLTAHQRLPTLILEVMYYLVEMEADAAFCYVAVRIHTTSDSRKVSLFFLFLQAT